MPGPFHRKSRRDPRREGQSLAPNNDVAGKLVNDFRYFLGAKYPPIRALGGRHQRREGSFDPIAFLRQPGVYRLFMHQPPPNPNVTRGAASRRGGRPPAWIQYTQTISSKYRVADTTIAKYELYIGVGKEPDYTQVPDATSFTLPVTHALAAPASGTVLYRATTRYRNQYNLLSLNQYSRAFEIDSNGDEVLPDPSAPEDVTLGQEPSFGVLVSAVYWWHDDGDNKADAWLVYSTDTGVDPDPSSDTPEEVAMSLTFGREQLFLVVGGFAAGADVRVLVRTKRTGDGATSTNTVATQIDVEDAPATPAGRTFGGTRAEYL